MLEEKEKNEGLNKKLKMITILENAVLAKLAKDKGITIKNVLTEEKWTDIALL